jgi:hypothetical protein
MYPRCETLCAEPLAGTRATIKIRRGSVILDVAPELILAS